MRRREFERCSPKSLNRSAAIEVTKGSYCSQFALRFEGYVPTGGQELDQNQRPLHLDRTNWGGLDDIGDKDHTGENGDSCPPS